MTDVVDANDFVAVPARSVGPSLQVAERGWGVHRTIGSAVRAAVEGGVIRVSPGTYVETLVLDSDVTIIAEADGGPVHLVSQDGPALLVRGGAVTLQNLTIRQSRPGVAAAQVTSGALALRDCDVSGGRLVVEGWGIAEISGCRLHHTDGPALFGKGDARIRIAASVIEDVDGTGIVLIQS